MWNSSIWPIDKTLSHATSLGQSGPRSDGSEGVFFIPQSFSITGGSPSDCLMLYPGHLLGVEAYSLADKLNELNDYTTPLYEYISDYKIYDDAILWKTWEA